MTVFDGKDTWNSTTLLSSDRLNKQVLWHRNGDPPEAGTNEIPTNGLYMDTDKGIIYENIGTAETPNWKKVSSSGETGTIIDFFGLESKIPSGYLRCNGAEVSKTEYADLYDKIGNLGGASSDPTKFKLPNLESENRFTRAAKNDSEIGQTGGLDAVTLTVAQIPSHGHSVSPNPHTHGGISGSTGNQRNQGGSGGGTIPTGSSVGSTSLSISSTGGGQSHENKPPYINVYKLIKT